MPSVAFTPHLRRFLEVPNVETRALVLRGYVLDDQGHLRPNVVVFVDGVRSADRVALADALQPGSRVFVLQALSGG
jgi:sulfur-carrier protein